MKKYAYSKQIMQAIVALVLYIPIAFKYRNYKHYSYIKPRVSSAT